MGASAHKPHAETSGSQLGAPVPAPATRPRAVLSTCKAPPRGSGGDPWALLQYTAPACGSIRPGTGARLSDPDAHTPTTPPITTTTGTRRSVPHPCSQEQRHSIGAAYSPTQYMPPISDAVRSAGDHQSPGTPKPRRGPPPGGYGDGPRPGADPNSPCERRTSGAHAAGWQHTSPVPRLETRALRRRGLVPQTTPPARR